MPTHLFLKCLQQGHHLVPLDLTLHLHGPTLRCIFSACSYWCLKNLHDTVTDVLTVCKHLLITAFTLIWRRSVVLSHTVSLRFDVESGLIVVPRSCWQVALWRVHRLIEWRNETCSSTLLDLIQFILKFFELPRLLRHRTRYHRFPCWLCFAHFWNI